MSVFRWLVGGLVMGLFLIAMELGGCVIADAGPCQTTDDCQKHNPPLFCARGWCVPKHIYDQVLAADEKKGTEPGPGDGGKEPGLEPSLEPDASVESDVSVEPDVSIEKPPTEQPTDENSCQNGETRLCGSDVGVCKKGTETCDEKGMWGTCVGGTEPGSESCNNLDDDCNGKIDDNVTRPCYTGPTGTEGKGRCKGGTETCNGGNWGTCIGDIKPGPKEICANKIDDNCDGKVDEDCLWAVLIEPTGTGSTVGSYSRIGVDGAGNVYVAGIFSGFVTVGTQSLTAANFDGFVAKFDSSGKFEWVLHLKGSGADSHVSIRDLVVDKAGNVFLVGSVIGSVTVGTVYTVTGPRDGFVTRIDTNGKLIWLKHFGTSTKTDPKCTTETFGIALDPNGQLFVTGFFAGSFLVNGQQIQSSNNCQYGYDVFVFKMDANGTVLKSFTKGYAYGQATAKINYFQSHRIGVDTNGDVVVCGAFEGGTIKLGNKIYSDPPGVQVFVFKSDMSGTVKWSHVWGNSTTDSFCEGLFVGGKGDVYLSTHIGETENFGKHTVYRPVDGLVTVSIESTGTVRWAQTHDAMALMYGAGIAVSPSGALWFGTSIKTATLGGVTHSAVGILDGFGIRVDNTGKIQEVKSVKITSSDRNDLARISDLAFDAEGSLFLFGNLKGTAVYGGKTVTTKGKATMFLIKNP